MSLLTIVQGACARLPITTIPTVVTTSTDNTVLGLYYLAQQEGKELARRCAWKALTAEKTFTTVATAAQTSALASDYDWIIPDTMFNRTTNRRVTGPASPEQWQLTQASLVTHVYPMFRIRGTSLLITPTPTAGDTVAYEYVTKNWCQSSGSTAQSAWAADTDTALLDEELMTLGLVWRWKRSKGLDAVAEFDTYQSEVLKAVMREGVRPRISTDADVRTPGADVIAGTRPNVILTDSGDQILWD